MKVISLLLFLPLSFLLFSCENKIQSSSRQDTLFVHELPWWQTADTLASGTFVNTDAHQLSGKVYVYLDVKDNVTLSIEELSVLGGPDVDVYLSDSNGYANVIHLGHLEGKDGQPVQGSLTYKSGYSTDYKKYNHVIIWCKKYSVLFGYAKLNLTPGFSGVLETP